MSQVNSVMETGADAAAAPAAAPNRSLLLRTAVGALALLGLSGIGAVSMLAGLDGAHASPPVSSSSWIATSSSSTGPPEPTPSAPIGSVEVTPVPTSPPPRARACEGRTEDGRIVLNLASLEDLRRLPGVGPKRAEAILALRAKLKRFKRGADLLRVRGIGPKSLARMQAHFVLDPPVGSDCENTSNAK